MDEKGTKKNQKGTTKYEKGTEKNQKSTKEYPKGTKEYPKGTNLPGGKGINVGYSLSRLLKMRNMSTTVLSGMLGINPKNARAMLKKKYLHAATMVKISEVLQHDIIRYLYLPENLPGNSGLIKRMQEMEKEMKALKKENEMLSEMNSLLKGGK